MATILTPNSIWGDFKIKSPINYQIIYKVLDGDFVFTHVYIEGRNTAKGKVKIYGTICNKINALYNMPLLSIKGEGADDETLYLKSLANKGYTVLSIDLTGNTSNAKYFTLYPNDVMYANFDKEKATATTVDYSVEWTCWYEWALAIRYSAVFLKDFSKEKKIAGICFGHFNTSFFHAVALNDVFSCAVFCFNGGSDFRSSKELAQDAVLSDDELAYFAGVAPQAYLNHINCPTLFLLATNSNDFNIDNVYDNFSLMKDRYYKNINYSVGNRQSLGYDCYKDLLLFLDRYLAKNSQVVLPKKVSIKINEIQNRLEIKPQMDELKNLSLYYSTENCQSKYRCWYKIWGVEKINATTFGVDLATIKKGEIIHIFAKAKYQNDFTVSSNILSYKFNEQLTKSFNNILFSSRIEGNIKVFYSIEKRGSSKYSFDLIGNNKVKMLNGPIDLGGVNCQNGLITFAIYSKNNKPNDNSILMFDACLKKPGIINVSLITDFYGEHNKYTASIKISEAGLWKNVRITQNDFKTFDGKMLKSFDEIEAIEFFSDKANEEDFILNNILWI